MNALVPLRWGRYQKSPVLTRWFLPAGLARQCQEQIEMSGFVARELSAFAMIVQGH
jgi:hypothetical protein